MLKLKLNPVVSRFAALAAAVALAVLAQATPSLLAQNGKVLQGGVQQNSTSATGDIYSSGSQASDSCSQQNTSPFAGMDPLSCHGVMAPTDSAGQCSLQGMQVLQQVGRECYYCQALNPPINGVIVPINQLNQARAQGYKCGVDQANPNCMAICVQQGGMQQSPSPQTPGDVFSSGGGKSQNSCSQQNTSPYAGMDPLSCYGVMAPVDSAGRCSLPRLQLLKQVGRECYYCQAKNPPTNGIIVPINQLRQASAQGYKCGVDQANPNCMAICVQQGGARQPPLRSKVQNPSCTMPTYPWPLLAALERITTQVANAERDALVNATNAMAPKYDMTKSGEGVRYMQDLLIRMGFSYLKAAIPAVMRGISTGEPIQLPSPIYSWSPRGGGGSEGLPRLPANLPPGLQLPRNLLTVPRPLRLQEEAASCGLACVRMLVETVLGVNQPESYYQGIAATDCDPGAYKPGWGAEIDWLQKLTQTIGLHTTIATGQTMDQLDNATRYGFPALVHLGPEKDGHFVVVDGFARDAANNLFVIGRDPTNLALTGAENRQTLLGAGFENYFVDAWDAFRGSWQGQVIYTNP
jgi:hypothetical protein